MNRHKCEVMVPAALWARITEVAEHAGTAPIDALRMLLARLSRLVEAGDTAWAGPEWAATTPKSEQRSAPTLPEPEAAKRGRPAKVQTIDPPTDAELETLHVSVRCKSGYYGVYPNGSGWRAIARVAEDSVAQNYIGQFTDPVTAAVARLRHYRNLGLPYGGDEEALDRMRKRGITGSDAELMQFMRDAEDVKRTGMIGFSAGAEVDPGAYGAKGDANATDEYNLHRRRLTHPPTWRDRGDRRIA